ncbi:Arc family DNA-binding protein [Vreelandella lionensis]|uniref:Arc family DNA-binding protein n=1 Tax=Vreelandella lionensis TaxID=1144478 RepID=A0ABW8BPF6_9GAMM
MNKAKCFKNIEAKSFIDGKVKMLHFCFMEKDIEVQANLKIPKSLKEKLKAAAKENHRSMTAEVVARLEQSFKDEQSDALVDDVPPEQMLKIFDIFRQELEEKIKRGEAGKGIPKLSRTLVSREKNEE